MVPILTFVQSKSQLVPILTFVQSKSQLSSNEVNDLCRLSSSSTAFQGNLRRWFRFRHSFCTKNTWNEVMEPPDFRSLKIFHGNSKTIVTCFTRLKEHAGRWNFALAPSEAKLSAITGFRHFSALDLTSEVTAWPRTLSSYINLYGELHARFFREALAQSGAKRQGVVPTPLVPWKDAKWPVPARDKTTFAT